MKNGKSEDYITETIWGKMTNLVFLIKKNSHTISVLSDTEVMENL